MSDDRKKPDAGDYSRNFSVRTLIAGAARQVADRAVVRPLRRVRKALLSLLFKGGAPL